VGTQENARKVTDSTMLCVKMLILSFNVKKLEVNITDEDILKVAGGHISYQLSGSEILFRTH